MQYQVPQFIEIEDKIFGPLTFKQFLYVAGGVALGFIIWAFIPVKFFALLLALPVTGFFMMAAFYKVNGRPFLFFVESFFRFQFSSKLFLWKKKEKKPVANRRKEPEAPQVQLPKLTESKLQELSWGLDIHENLMDKNKIKEKQNK